MINNEKHQTRWQNISNWIDYRLPIFTFLRKEGTEYPTPRNLNYWWNTGSLAGVTLVIMMLTGIFLAIHYIPNTEMAFDSIERIMREVNYGWFLRYIHMNGATMFFIVIYLHLFRGLYYGSYKNPRELLWILGVILLILIMATAFMGYVLPWGQMSFWGATVITNLFSAIPWAGEGIVEWLWGGFSISNPTLNRFFVLHYLFPFLILGVIILHLVALHQHGSNNPLGINAKGPKDKIPFHPYYTVKDIFGLAVFFIIWGGFVFFSPNFFGEAENYIPADPLVTPLHIVPEWYFLPFYAILRSVPDKLSGVFLMFSSIFVLFVVPWLDTSPIRSSRFRPLYKYFFWFLIIACIVLGWAGSQKPEGLPLIIGRIATFYYFAHFLIIMPLIGRIEKRITLPKDLTTTSMKQRGAGKLKSISTIFVLGIFVFFTHNSLGSSDETLTPTKHDWSFQSPAGTFDRSSLQRGLQVYKEVCSTCHGIKQLRFDSLKALGYEEDEIKAIAAEQEVIDGPNDEGEMFERPALPSDHFPSPYRNEQATRAANNGAYPSDLSVIVKGRPGGANYIYALLAGYAPCPDNITLQPSMYYNPFFSGQQIAMPPPLSRDIISYQDGTEATVEQMSHDVTTFLSWAAEPEMEARKKMGFKVLIFLTVFAILMYLTMHQIWRRIK
jgi:ubiquinol-cytochrome c reductase cytochrome b/c1 subunit